MSIAEEAQTDALLAITREAIAREIIAEFADVSNVRRDAIRAADRIIHLLRQGKQR